MQERNRNEAHPWIMAIIIGGIFIGGGSIVFLALRTFISIDSILLCFLAFGSAAFLILFLLVRKRKRHLAETLAEASLGWGSLATGCLLALNYFGHDETFTRRYPYEDDTEALASAVIKHDSGYLDYPYLLSFEELEAADPTKRVEAVELSTAEGLFGYRVVVRKRLIFE
jgi:hypothetical protein